jgi:hypothetical protein
MGAEHRGADVEQHSGHQTSPRQEKGKPTTKTPRHQELKKEVLLLFLVSW